MTPREIDRLMRAARARHHADFDLLRWQVWNAENLSRAKALPAFDQFARRRTRDHQSAAVQAQSLDRWAAALNSGFVR